MNNGKTVILLYCPDDFAFHLGIAFIETITTYYDNKKCGVVSPVFYNTSKLSFKGYLASPQSHFIKAKELNILAESMNSSDNNVLPNTESLNKIYATERFLKIFHGNQYY